MPDKKEQTIIIVAVSISAIMLVTLVIWNAVSSTPTLQSQTPEPQLQTEYFHHESPPSRSLDENTDEFTKTDIELDANYEPTLNDIIKAAKTWKPIYHYWLGRKAPDFTLADTNGKQHKLSDYKGKDVMIIFWATWCGPCIMEIPHLIALRNTISEDNLAMLAISKENLELVKQFIADKKINYTVLLSGENSIPTPYKRVRSIPCSFFIDPEGKIKLATSGLLSLGEIKAILQAPSKITYP